VRLLLTLLLLSTGCQPNVVDLGPASTETSTASVMAEPANPAEAPEPAVEASLAGGGGKTDPSVERDASSMTPGDTVSSAAPMRNPPDSGMQEVAEPQLQEPDALVDPPGNLDPSQAFCEAETCDGERFCNRGDCVECVSSFQCAQLYGPSRGSCVYGRCQGCYGWQQCQLWTGSCQNGECVANLCFEDSDCSPGQRCVTPQQDPGHAYCVAECSLPYECRMGYWCDLNARLCIPEPPHACREDRDCPPYMVCMDGSCSVTDAATVTFEDNQVVVQAPLPAPAATPGTEVSVPAEMSCGADADCPTGFVCVDQVCLYARP
jgi:hypothetical protein